MRTLPARPRFFEFCFPRLDTLLQVEVMDEAVVIRATRDTFSTQRKVCFVRELASEGFIPDEYRWFSLAGEESTYRGVRWMVDFSWLELNRALAARARRFVLRLEAFAALTLALLLGLAVTGHLDGRTGRAQASLATLVARAPGVESPKISRFE